MTGARCWGRCRARGCGWRKRRRSSAATGWKPPTPAAAQLKQAITDDAQLIEAAGHPVAVVEGAPSNLKITTKGDLHLAEAILKSRPKPKGTGPIHPFAEEEMWGGRGV